MRRPGRFLPWRGAALVTLTAALLGACGPSDPRQRVLDQRARWDVTVLGWSQAEDGTMTMSVRVSGPPSSTLKALTVRVQLNDDTGAVAHTFWHTIDLSDVPRGGPVDKSIRSRDVPPGMVEAGVDRVLQPTPEEEAYIRELAPGTP